MVVFLPLDVRLLDAVVDVDVDKRLDEVRLPDGSGTESGPAERVSGFLDIFRFKGFHSASLSRFNITFFFSQKMSYSQALIYKLVRSLLNLKDWSLNNVVKKVGNAKRQTVIFLGD
jgi:hypothetical protein